MAFNRKKTPTREARLATASALSHDALSLFDQAALNLELAAGEKNEIANEVAAEAADLEVKVLELNDQADYLDESASDDLHAAERIRSLFA